MRLRSVVVRLRGLLLVLCGWVSMQVQAADTALQLPAEPLQLIRALPVAVPEGSGISGLQPSGLAFCDNKLLMVSDRHNQQIFRLQIEDEAAVAESWLTLSGIPRPDLGAYDFGTRWWSHLSRRFDWEGISCDGQQRLYLLSETLAQVLIRETDGGLHWTGSASYRAGQEAGLFQQRNALAEGLAVSGERMVIAAERQPRGLVLMRSTGEGKQDDGVRPGAAEKNQAHWQISGTRYLSGFPSLLRPVDFAGLWLEEQALYTLERNHFQVCRRHPQTAVVQRCWSYRHVEQKPALAYADQRFGKAEGLARSGRRLYLVLDNNGGGRSVDGDDRRPQLFIFQLPETW